MAVHSGAGHDDKLVVYQHLQLPGHSPSDIKVQILEKVHKKFGCTKLTKSEQERVELKWSWGQWSWGQWSWDPHKLICK